MTYSILPTEAPTVLGTYEDAAFNQKLIESNIAMLEMYIRKLSLEKDQLVKRRTLIVRQMQQHQMRASSIGKLPIASLSQFLRAADISNLSATSRYFREECYSDKQLLLVHLTTPKIDISFVQAEELLGSVCLNTVESLSIDAKKPSGKNLMKALASKASLMTSLKSVRISAAAEGEAFIGDVNTFMCNLAPNQITSLHVSGLRTLSQLVGMVSNQSPSIENFKVDYFVNGHERDITCDHFPRFPKLRSLVFDVADVVDLPISLLIDRLASIENKEAVEVIYLPHMQIAGDSGKMLEFVTLLRKFPNVRQIVVRFRHLPLSVKDIVSLRESFDSLPAVCISDHFIVMLDSWASWWPQQTQIWDRPERITGLSVFREQIDFESLGTTAQREWLKLTAEQKDVWSRRIAPRVRSLYMEQYQQTAATSAIRSASV